MAPPHIYQRFIRLLLQSNSTDRRELDQERQPPTTFTLLIPIKKFLLHGPKPISEIGDIDPSHRAFVGKAIRAALLVRETFRSDAI